MPLHGYGLLIGSVTGSRPQRGGSPHWLLMVQPGTSGHPPYRVAVNLQSSQPGAPPEVQYQVVDIDREGSAKLKALAQKLKAMGASDHFILANDASAPPTLDFVRGDLLDPAKYLPVPAGVNPFQSAFQTALADAAAADQKGGALVAVFGTGYPIDQRTGAAQPTGFDGIDNIHMNQGSLNSVTGAQHYLENGPNQDGGLIFLLPDGPRGFFMKFQTQMLQTDNAGNPTMTGIEKPDSTDKAVRRAIMPPPPRRRAVAARITTGRARPNPTAGTSATPDTTHPAAAAKGFIFADPNPDDANQPFIADDDAGAYKTPFVMDYGKGKTRGPVPTPAAYPVMNLSDVMGSTPQGYQKSAAGETIRFDMAGDTGAPSDTRLGREMKVTELMVRNAGTAPPAFLFHVGDVVYFYGEEDYYYSQFYKPFQGYPAPIFAIPGNHDGVTYKPEMESLAGFKAAFCAPAPARSPAAGGILRTTMTQPGVYFTLDAPLVSIIGLYSNCGESLGWLDEQQLLFLYHELVRLKALRESSGQAVILAIHHCPSWFPDSKKKNDPTSAAIDKACEQAGFWPDAVVCGHAHVYQRIVRQLDGRDLPYVITGAGGYDVNPKQEVAKEYMATLTGGGNRQSRFVPEPGYVTVTVSRPAQGHRTLRFEYNSVQQSANEPDDVCTIDLTTNQLVM